ncbi:trypsin-like peptidase domain-containing protein [Rummeliibacillus pycnus]|uniref:S1C family serine protease n=1 Tax=Rummeliibacillus pycnus TaxID=101070 RepID=UPI0037C7FFFD
MTNNRRYQPKKASIKRIAVSIVLLIAVISGAYMLLAKNDKAATDNNHIKVQNVHKTTTEKPTEKKDPDSKKETDSTGFKEGTVTNAIQSNNDGDTTTKDSTNVIMPKNDTSAIIANAKTQVYTVYTDLQQGSGFLFDKKGDIITNAHVAKDASYVFVTNEHGQEFQGQVIGISKKTDVALIRVPELAGKDPLVLDTASARVNTPVIAIGSPNNKGGTATEGKITSIGAEFTDEYTYNGLYEMTARLHSGSSGGPLINAETGNVIGINSIILTDEPEIGYAIPISKVMSLITTWSNKDVKISIEKDQDFEDNHKEEAYLGKKLIKDYVDGYYELFPYAIKNKSQSYYETYIMPGSSAINTAKKMVESYSTDEKKYKDLQHTIGKINIYDAYATVEVNSTFVYTDKKTKQEHKLKETIVYTVVIDDYGDYQFTKIDVTNSSDSADDNQPTNTEPGSTNAETESTNSSNNKDGSQSTTTEEDPSTIDKQSVNSNVNTDATTDSVNDNTDSKNKTEDNPSAATDPQKLQ